MAWGVVAACVLLAGMPAALAFEPEEVLESIRSAELVEEPVRIEALHVDLGHARLDLIRGVLYPATDVAGRPMEFVFEGEARFRLHPPDAVEAGQLELFAGTPYVDVEVRRAVLATGNPGLTARLVEREPAPRDFERDARARERFASWLGRPERRVQGTEGSLLRAGLDDPTYRRYVAVWFDTDEHGELFYQIDPDELEQATLAKFVPLGDEQRDLRRLGRHLRTEQRRGRWIGVRAEDLGVWDVWSSATLPGEDGEPRFGDHGFEPHEYRLDVEVQPYRGTIDGRAVVDLRHENDGRRVVAFELHPDVRLRTVTNRLGEPLFVHRAGSRALVVLSEPSVRGRRDLLTLGFGGPMIERTGRRSFALRDTSRWYPQTGTLNRARYDITYRWPKRLELVTGGRRVDGGTRDGVRWERRRIDVPGIAASFEIGEFLVQRYRVGHIDVRLAFDRVTAIRMSPAQRREVARTTEESIAFFQAVFGHYPLTDLTIATVQRSYSQAFLGFVTLSASTFAGDSRSWQQGRYQGPREWRSRRPLRRQTLAHEMAHQWWGNLVGWRSYRDQWLSEAVANYAALLYLDFYGGGGERRYLSALSEGWQRSLVQRLKDGRTVESVGPLVLGERLNSSKAVGAYQAIVYRKGAVVLAMLARSFSEAQFLEMLRALATAAEGRVISTDQFVRSLERMSGTELDEFAERYIYGTGIPEVYYALRFEPAEDDHWFVRGEAHRISIERYRHEVVSTGPDAWDVTRARIESHAAADARLVVPVRVELEPVEIASERGGDGRGKRGREKGAKRGGRRGWQASATLESTVELADPIESFEIRVPGRPREVRFDPRGEVLASFRTESASPKAVFHLRAREFAASGRAVEAERLYLQALAAERDPAELAERDHGRKARREDALLDARVRIDYARLLLDEGREAEAEVLLREVRRDARRAEAQPMELDIHILSARLELRRGQARAAYNRLRPFRDLLQPRRGFRTWLEYAWFLEVRSRRADSAELIALYGAAAHAVGEERELAWAVGEGEARGIDFSALTRED